MQHEIKCPNCGKVFTIDEVSYAEILSQVRNKEFTSELESRLHELEKANVQAVENAKLMVKSNFERELSEKDQEITRLRSQLSSDVSEAKADLMERFAEEKSKQQEEISELKSRLAGADADKKLAVTEAVAEVISERDRLKSELDNAETLNSSKMMMMRQNYEQQIRDREDTIERLKEMKSRMSTKMVGDSLEQHCQNEFNSIRATAFPRAEFGKDNTVSASRSKGDFIFRDFDEEGTEIVSIMFEMKNENDTTASKHKNEHFFKELDKDRREKGCEYAVLVSLLEADNEFYNRGIVDVSYEYPKMYVIRPQFFLTLIGLITNTARNALEYKRELMVVRNQNIDVTNFEKKLNDFKDSFALNSERASKNFNKAIEDIDKSIKFLEETKEALLKTIKNFGVANNKLEDLTVKRLTRGNPTMTAMFEELE